ncbi:MAG: sulfite exporter TauE/SafE family protein [Alphaproteobacteria bacterium]|nr:sulfite exporter TauE/SafE family protein [Alphaproteobacteria bacterium]
MQDVLAISDLTWMHYAGIAIVAFIASMMGAMSGFGSGLIVIAFLAPIIGSKATIPVTSVAMVFSNFSRIWFNRREIDWRVALYMMVPAVPFAVVGAYFYSTLSGRGVDWLIGIVLSISVPLRRFLHRHRYEIGSRGLAAFGAGFGLFAGATPGMGPLLVSILMWAGLRGPGLIGTDGIAAMGVNLTKAVFFSQAGLLDTELTIAGMLIGLCTIPGAYAARLIVLRLGLRMHTLLMEGLLVVCGIWFVGRALQASFGS